MRAKIFLIGLGIFFATFISQNSKPECSFILGLALIIFSLNSNKKI